MADLSFVPPASTVPENDFAALPAGDYLAAIVAVDFGPNSKGTGDALKVTLEVLDGEFAGRNVFARQNLRHNNPQAQAIGQREYAEMLRAVGLEVVNNTNELLAQQVVITLKVRPADAQYDASNEVKKYRSAATYAPPGAAPAVTAAPPPGAGAPAAQPYFTPPALPAGLTPQPAPGGAA